jgi:hypothetical protein
MQDRQQTRTRSTQRLVAPDALELALERTLGFERVPVDKLHGAQDSHEVPRQPHLAIATAPDLPQQFMVWDGDGTHGSGILIHESRP